MENNFDVIYNGSTDPFFNLAAEEYLLDRADDRPVFMLWRNSNTVVIGRNQNAYAEVNEPFVREHGINVVRRLTGGGAVFHDEGNLNYTFIVPRQDDMVLNFAHFSKPIIGALNALGANAELSGRNDVAVGGHKVSGNAQCVRGGRIMHHGTLLWSADMDKLSGALNVDPEKISAKGIKSVRARVVNLKDLLCSDMSCTELADHIFSFTGAVPRDFDDAEKEAISALSRNKYSTWEWNWGESKQFSSHGRRRFPFGTVDLRFDAKNGLIDGISITGDFFGTGEISNLESALQGTRLEFSELEKKLSSVGEYIAGASPAKIAELFFKPY